MSDVFGTSIDGDDVEQAIKAHLEAWMPTYIAEVERQKGWESYRLPVIRNFTVVNAAAEKWPEDQLPMILIVSPGFAAPPEEEGSGRIGASYSAAVAAIASGRDDADTKAITRAYYAAARMAMLQHPSLSGFANSVKLRDERFDRVTKGVDAERNLAACAGVFSVRVDQILDRSAGIMEPLEDPYVEPPEWPVADEGNQPEVALA